MHMTTEPSCLSTGDQTILCPLNQYLVMADKTDEKATDSVPLPVALTIALSNTLLTNGTIPLNASNAAAALTTQTVKLDLFQDLALPPTFICTGQPLILPVTIDPAATTTTPTPSSAITLKDLNFTYCPAKP